MERTEKSRMKNTICRRLKCLAEMASRKKVVRQIRSRRRRKMEMPNHTCWMPIIQEEFIVSSFPWEKWGTSGDGEMKNFRACLGECHFEALAVQHPRATSWPSPPRWEACHLILSRLRLPANQVPLPPQGGARFSGAFLNHRQQPLCFDKLITNKL